MTFAQPYIHTRLRETASLAYWISVRSILRRCGDVHSNPGPIIRIAQWYSTGLSLEKRLMLEK